MIRGFARTRAWAAVLGLLVGCAGGGGGGGGGGGKPACKPPTTPTVSFSTNIQPIFNRSCALAGCHDASRVSGLDLSLGKSHASIVGQRSITRPDKVEVKPGAPDDSYLINKIEGAAGISGQQMPNGCPGQPQGGAVCLSADDMAALRTWVTECATK